MPRLTLLGRQTAFALLLAPLAGCAGMNHASEGALVGTTIGALAGGIIGHQSGNTGAGAVLGAGAGMIGGALVGDAEDAREERDWAIRQASYERVNYEPPLTNADLIYMAQNGLGDDVIINSIKSRGGRFDVDPTALVQLKQSGVSDVVISEVQRAGGRVVAAPGPGPGATRVVYVEPYYPPPPRWSFHYGPSCYGPHWHHGCHW
jgi:hypothetical protein